MYIQKAEIKDIRSIEEFEIEFPNPAGWHVLIGDNGSGKSTIIRSIALALVGHRQVFGLRPNWKDWVNRKSSNGSIKLSFITDEKFDKFPSLSFDFTPKLVSEMTLNMDNYFESAFGQSIEQNIHTFSIEEISDGFFSIAFGPYRRFEGGSSEWDEVYNNPSLARLASHLSIFDESVALTEPIKWLKDLQYKSLERNEESENTLKNLKKLINSEGFLPHETQLISVNSNSVIFIDGNEMIVSVNQMSDGYRSILSLTFELIRQLVRVYGSDLVFKNIESGEMFIDLPGVVLIDEIDAHLHPTWQTRIGNWFLKYFPKLQFIVTTHSPLVCRAAENGSIWRLAAPGSDEKSGEVTGIDRERLIYGNILDAYGTGVFGENTLISENSNEMLNRLSELNVKSMMGLISDKESNELQELRTKSPTEDTQKRTSEWLVEKFEKLENYLKEKETSFTKQEEESRTEYQKSRIILAQEWKNLKAILGMSKADLDKEKEK